MIGGLIDVITLKPIASCTIHGRRSGRGGRRANSPFGAFGALFKSNIAEWPRRCATCFNAPFFFSAMGMRRIVNHRAAEDLGRSGRRALCCGDTAPFWQWRERECLQRAGHSNESVMDPI